MARQIVSGGRGAAVRGRRGSWAGCCSGRLTAARRKTRRGHPEEGAEPIAPADAAALLILRGSRLCGAAAPLSVVVRPAEGVPLATRAEIAEILHRQKAGELSAHKVFE